MGYEHPGINTVFIGHLLDCKKTKWGAGVAYNDSTCLRPMWLGFEFIMAPTLPTCNPNWTRNQEDKEPLSGCATSKSLLNYCFFLEWLLCKLRYVSILTKIVPVSFCVTIIQF